MATTAEASNFQQRAQQSLLEKYQKNRSRQLNALRIENEFCDLILNTEDGLKIGVHKIIISSSGNYFRDLLTMPMRERSDQSILLPSISGRILEKILTYIYTSEFNDEIIEDVEEIIKHAVMFQLEELIEICSLILSESITDQTYLKYWRFARTNLIYDFENKCLAYIASEAGHLFETSSMSDLTIEEMKSVLADDKLHSQFDEETIFDNVWKWAENKVCETNKTSSQVFSEVVDLFNFSKLEKFFVYQKLFDNENVLDNAEFLKKIAKLTKQSKIKDEVGGCYIFRKPNQLRLVGLAVNKIFIGLGEESTIEKEIDLQNEFSYTTFMNLLLKCGGGNSNSCEIYKPSTNQWQKIPSMKTKRMRHGCSHLDNKIYTCGGILSKTIEIFEFEKGEWNYGPEMNTENWDFGLTGINRALYAIGGETDNVEHFDPRTQKWNVICSDSRIHNVVRCVSIGPCIYCFTSEMRFIFDTRSNKFSEAIFCNDFNSRCNNYCELDGYIYGFGYQKDRSDKYSLNLVQYHLNGKQGFKKSYGLYNTMEITESGIVCLYYNY